MENFVQNKTINLRRGVQTETIFKQKGNDLPSRKCFLQR